MLRKGPKHFGFFVGFVDNTSDSELSVFKIEIIISVISHKK